MTKPLVALALVFAMIIVGALLINGRDSSPTSAVGTSEQTPVDQGSKTFD
jgi:hypothetical protein